MNESMNRLLVALDGSEQASVVVNYVAEVFPPQKTQIVLFHVLTAVPEALYDFDQDEGIQVDPDSANAFVSEKKKKILGFLNLSKQKFMEKGFSEEQVEIVVEPLKKGVARDILAFSGEGFKALVLGRTGVSRVKDLIIGSVASKLLGKVSNIPLIVVGKENRSGGILIAYDGSEGADKAVMTVGKLLGKDSRHITLLHVIRSLNILYLDEIQRSYPLDAHEWTEKHRETIDPILDRAMGSLAEVGINPGNISRKILTDQVSRAEAVVQEARDGEFSSIVIGRRGLSLVEEFFLGRVGKKIFQMSHDITVWVVP